MGTYKNHPPDSIANQLHSIAVPTLVLTGDDYRFATPELSRKLAREIPETTFQIIPECGHLPQEERPSLFIEAMQGFVDERH